MLALKPDKRYRFKNFTKNQYQKESNTQRFERQKVVKIAKSLINHTLIKFGCLQFLLKRNNTKVREKNSITFIVELVLILWNGLFAQSIEEEFSLIDR